MSLLLVLLFIRVIIVWFSRFWKCSAQDFAAQSFLGVSKDGSNYLYIHAHIPTNIVLGFCTDAEGRVNGGSSDVGDSGGFEGSGGGSAPETPALVELTTLTSKTLNNTPLNFSTAHLWTDVTNIYYSGGSNQYVLNSDTWEKKNWNGLTSFYGDSVWTDGTNYYCSNGFKQYVFS